MKAPDIIGYIDERFPEKHLRDSIHDIGIAATAFLSSYAFDTFSHAVKLQSNIASDSLTQILNSGSLDNISRNYYPTLYQLRHLEFSSDVASAASVGLLVIGAIASTRLVYNVFSHIVEDKGR